MNIHHPTRRCLCTGCCTIPGMWGWTGCSGGCRGSCRTGGRSMGETGLLWDNPSWAQCHLANGSNGLDSDQCGDWILFLSPTVLQDPSSGDQAALSRIPRRDLPPLLVWLSQSVHPPIPPSRSDWTREVFPGVPPRSNPPRPPWESPGTTSTSCRSSSEGSMLSSLSEKIDLSLECP